MDKRTFLALVLTAVVIIGLPALFRVGQRPAPQTAIDTTAAVAAPAPAATTPAVTTAPPAAQTPGAPTVGVRPDSTAVATAPIVAVDTTAVGTGQARMLVSSVGAAPIAVDLPQYRNLRPGANGTVVLRDVDGALLGYRVVVNGRDTVDLRGRPFRVEKSDRGAAYVFDGPPSVRIEYESRPGTFLTQIRGSVAGAGPGSVLLVDLPSYIGSAEADTTDDVRHLAYGYKPRNDDVVSEKFSSLDSTVVRTDTGTLHWVATRTKYFLAAVIAPDNAPQFAGLRMRGGSRGTRGGPVAYGTAVLPIPSGQFSFDLYAGPQTWRDLRAVGRDFENVNPVGGWFEGIVQPFATIVMRMLLWLKATLNVNYGWVLVIFGILVRLALWPANQSAMRTSMKMQRLQPELQVIQKKYANDRAAQQDAIMKLYASHGMSPLSPLLGCLPMLLPMPVLFALYFVFQNTIEFRGVSFLWLPDISLKDPLYITPIFMGVSMFVLSWIGMRGAPPNPQAKMMTYMFPAVFTIMFLNFASGLNLYYAVQNVAALPQQWLIARERSKAAPVPVAPPKRSGAG